MNLSLKGKVGDVLTLLAGSALTLSLAPFNWIWLPPLLLTAFLLLIQQQTLARARWHCFLFALGFLGTGASWVYVSIYDYTNTPAAFAVFLTFAFVAIMAAVFAMPLCLWNQILQKAKSQQSKQWVLLLGFPAIWVLDEWYRSWFMTGFAWLYIGYSQTESYLGGWAPLISVYGISFWLALIASSIVFAWNTKRHIWLPIAIIACAVGGGKILDRFEWTSPVAGTTQSVALIQGNVAQEEKWVPEQLQAIRTLYRNMSMPFWKTGQLVIWPEAAIPDLYTQEKPFFNALNQDIADKQGALILGVPSLHKSEQGQNILYNSLLGMGGAHGFYHKRRLVPFGEYVPLQHWLEDLLDFFKLPMSEFSLGPDQQADLYTGKLYAAGSICYEITYPELIAKQARDADFLLTVSNDSWFGHSIGPHQHMQMAQMRARENARELVRATSNGISAFVDYRGHIVSQTPQFIATTLQGDVQARRGITPYQRWGNAPILFICFGLLVFALGVSRFCSFKRSVK